MEFSVIRVDKWGYLDVVLRNAEYDDVLNYFTEKYNLSKVENNTLYVQLNKAKIADIFVFKDDVVIKVKDKQKETKNVFLF